jgi:hypothetical protein
LLPRQESAGDVTVVLRIDGELLDGRIGPFDAAALAELERVGGDGYGTPIVLAAVFDSYEVDLEGDSSWVRFSKTITPQPQGA